VGGERAEAIAVELDKRTVLLLDSDPQSERHLTHRLEAAGFEVLVAPNGLRLVSRLDVDEPDVLVMHTASAWTDCFDLCRSLKCSDKFKDVRVVLVADEASGAARARAACCDRWVPNERDAEPLLAAIRELLEPEARDA
jgi:DNA-binding response OmpR family regulator